MTEGRRPVGAVLLRRGDLSPVFGLPGDASRSDRSATIGAATLSRSERSIGDAEACCKSAERGESPAYRDGSLRKRLDLVELWHGCAEHEGLPKGGGCLTVHPMLFLHGLKRGVCLVTLLALCARGALAFDPAEQDDSLAVLRHFEQAELPEPFVDGRFEPREGETITLIGGTAMFEYAGSGYLENLLQQAFPERHLSVRNIAWSADTVYRQQRPMFFFTATGDTREGSVPDLRDKITPGILILQFGKMESLDGESALPGFRKAYDRLLGELQKISPRIVLLAPTPFFPVGPAGELAESRNAVLANYRTAISELAAAHGALFVDVEHRFDPDFGEFRRDGVRLADAGHLRLTGIICDSLQLPKHSLDPELLDRVHEKDQLWLQYYRPTNWAFLFGDRQNVPSSRDHKDDDRRWFVEEIQRLPALIQEADEEIWRAAAQ